MVHAVVELDSTQKFADTLRSLGFAPAHADPDAWLRDGRRCCECVVVCVDDMFTALLNPDKFCKKSQSDPWNCNLKNVEEPGCHLGGDCFRDKDGTFCCGVQTCVKRL